MADEEDHPVNSIPRPTTEEDCAKICSYKYIQTNVLGAEERQQQRDYIENRYGLGWNEADPCKCVANDNDDSKCYDDTCLNRNDCVACAPSCGPKCKNNPWIKNDFAAGKKTYIQYDEKKGYGLFASDVIKKDEWIGEYTGQIVPLNEAMTSEQESYSFHIANAKQKLDSYKEGSCIRLINHSCNPNCESWVYIHEMSYKVVYVARREILVDQELTVNYRWEYTSESQAVVCLCNSKKKAHYIGTFRKENKNETIMMAVAPASDDDTDDITSVTEDKQHILPDTAQAAGVIGVNQSTLTQRGIDASTTAVPECVDHSTSSDKDLLLPIVYDFGLDQAEGKFVHNYSHAERPTNFKEDHVFKPISRVFALVWYQGGLRIISGITIRCSLSTDMAVLYTVACSESYMKFEVVRWLCHHFHEDAQLMLEKLINEDDMRMLEKYTLHPGSIPTRELLPDYRKSFNEGTLPKTELVCSEILAPFAIGAPTHRLIVNQTEHVTTTTTSDVTMDQEKDSIGMVGTCCTSAKFYDPRHRNKSISSTLSECQQQLFLHRMLEMSCEMVATFAMSRVPKVTNHTMANISYTTLYRKIHQDLEMFYFEVSPQNRRFLSFSHYKLAINIDVEGSLGWLWCSLCNLAETFPNDEALRDHFESSHAICARSYSCYTPNCTVSCTLPSEFRRHLDICNPKISAGLIFQIPEFIMDSFADYLRSKSQGNETMYLTQPGLPSSIVCQSSGQLKNKKQKMMGDGVEQPEITKMNLTSRTPFNPCSAPLPLQLRIQEHYSTLQAHWPDHPAVDFLGGTTVIDCLSNHISPKASEETKVSNQEHVSITITAPPVNTTNLLEAISSSSIYKMNSHNKPSRFSKNSLSRNRKRHAKLPQQSMLKAKDSSSSSE